MGKEKGEKRGKEKKNQDVEELRQKGGKRFISPVRCWGGGLSFWKKRVGGRDNNDFFGKIPICS